MSADKRSVATDATATIGTIITENEKRDAIHLAVEPVVAAHKLRPGQDVGFLGDGTVGVCDNIVGIVDPFLEAVVKKGERFWLVVYPRTITSLRHVWTHPAFVESPAEAKVEDVGAKASARVWLQDYARELGASYEELLDHARAYLARGEYWIEGGRFEGESLPEQFWGHYELATGEKVEEGKRWSFFSCSC